MGASTPLPSPAAIARAELFTRERFVYEGESLEDALAPGSARRGALDAALSEIEGGAKVPSIEWRRAFSLLLGLERLLSEDEPKLVDGTVLSAHQVDALSGTLTALLAEAQLVGHAHSHPPMMSSMSDLSQANGAEAVAAPDADDEDEDDEEDEEAEERRVAAELAKLEEGEEGEPQDWQDEDDDGLDEDVKGDTPEDPNADRRFWFEHATGAGKTVAALGFVEASHTGGVLILTHRRNLVDQFIGELKDRGYRDRISAPLMKGEDSPKGPVTIETYQWFVRNAGKISDAYTIVICDEAHTALGEKTSASIRAWSGPVFIGMTATGALIARHVTDLFPTQTSRFDLAQAARRGVISPLRCIRIPPGPGVRTIAKVPLRRGEVDTEFDQEMLAELLDQAPFNIAIADLYKTRFNGVPGVVYAAGVSHAMNVAAAMRSFGINAQGVSGETPKRQLAKILADYEAGKVDVLVNAQLLAEGWNSPRATICMHLAPTASKRIYQQRVGRVTRRHPGKESGIVIDFVHPATKHDDPVVTLHSLLDRDVYRGGAIVVGPVRRGRGRRVRVERRVLPVTPDPDRRAEVFERELWRIAVEHLDYGEQHVWAALAGARVAPNGWRRAKAMLHFDRQGELKRRFLLTAVQRNRNAQLRLRALQEIAAAKDAEAFDTAIDIMAGWPRDERREGVKIMLQALAERRIGRRDQANAWIWRMAEYTREVHEEYAVQRWPETKRLLGLLVNSSGAAHARNARRLVHATRKEDRRLSAALLAAALAHTPEAEEALRGARTRMARKPAALARELLRNFPKGKRGKSRRRRKTAGSGANGVGTNAVATAVVADGLEDEELTHVRSGLDADDRDDDDDDLDLDLDPDDDDDDPDDDVDDHDDPDDDLDEDDEDEVAAAPPVVVRRSVRSRRRTPAVAAAAVASPPEATEPTEADAETAATQAPESTPLPQPRTRTRTRTRTRRPSASAVTAAAEAVAAAAEAESEPKPDPAPEPQAQTPRRRAPRSRATASRAPQPQTPEPAEPNTEPRTSEPVEPQSAEPQSAEPQAAEPQAAEPQGAEPPADAASEPKPKPRTRTRTPRKPKAPASTAETPAESAPAEEAQLSLETQDAPAPKPRRTRRRVTAPADDAEAA